MKAQILANEDFKKDPITIAVNKLNNVLREYGYKCDGISIRPDGDINKVLYILDGFVVTKKTYESIKEEN